MVKEWQISANANALLRWKGMKNAVLLIVFLTTANALQAQVPDSIVAQALQEVAADTLPELTIDTAAVNALTVTLRADGYTVVGEPRTTGDGYYESVVFDPEQNRIEITV